VEDYLTDRERVDWLRGWLKENLPWMLAGLAIAGAGIVGFRQFQAWQVRQGGAASQKYNAGLDALSRADRDGALRIDNELKSSYSHGPYADLLDFAIARYDVETGKLDEGARRLELLESSAGDTEMRVVARLRLARVQRAQGKLDAALATLAGVPAGSGSAAFTEVRGDVLADKGDRAGARKAWQEALETKVPGMVNRELLELKVAALGAPTAAAAAPAAAPAGGTQ
jgi:predicted negative regulator of RcsB-dependent stress response